MKILCKWFGHKYIKKEWETERDHHSSFTCKRCGCGGGGSIRVIPINDGKAKVTVSDGVITNITITNSGQGWDSNVISVGHGGPGGKGNIKIRTDDESAFSVDP